ncbi:hypothetical protein [Mucilaginibacter pedocola]|uniref:Uncharacterized protein n=1 Tax=Mucilaginibacter pedocola TaxID=1792845 RepID=A0A1S9P929_9SPHI|nr:hypothetical protein [Mucilaginibacter pedocola]OOQ57419.1 hypothetical protein BC343_15080 [Mucilaginibacter pedocola]
MSSSKETEGQTEKDQSQRSKKRNKLLDFLGIPSKDGWIEFLRLLFKMRFLFVVYLLVLALYLWIFKGHKDYWLSALSNYFGEGFGVSFSASAFEDLMMFMFLTLAISIISIKLSTKNPEDHEFDSRIKAIMNSQHVKNNFHVFDFLKGKISILLAYNKAVHYDVHIIDYFEETRIFHIIVKRIQVMTNMCKDRDFESPNRAITILPDKVVNGSFGKVISLKKIDPSDFQHTLETKITATDNYQLVDGLNPINFNYLINQDSELGIELTYEVYAAETDIDKLENWSYCEVSRFTSSLNFTIHNQLKGENINLKVQKMSSEGLAGPIIDYVISPGNPYNSKEKHLLPNEKILYYTEVSKTLLLEK